MDSTSLDFIKNVMYCIYELLLAFINLKRGEINEEKKSPES
jgi:hypothetical protein